METSYKIFGVQSSNLHMFYFYFMKGVLMTQYCIGISGSFEGLEIGESMMLLIHFFFIISFDKRQPNNK